MIEKRGHKAATYVALVGALVPVGFAAWAETSPITLVWLADEDGPIEDLSAILFFVAWAYFFTLSWAALMAVFVGEEISWEQRILGVPTPEFLEEINIQSELNVHNIAWLYEVIGAPHSWLTLMVLLTGLVITPCSGGALSRRIQATQPVPQHGVGGSQTDLWHSPGGIRPARRAMA